MAGQAGGTLGLVNDLSVKLQKQRKQLNALVKEVKSAADSELTWKHYLGVIVVNNAIVMFAGFVAGMLLYGIGPQEGSFTAGQISATGLTVQSPTGQTDMMVQSSTAGSEVAIQAATIAEVALEPFGDESLPYKFRTSSGNQLTLSQGSNVHMEVFTWQNGTDVKFNSPQVLIAGNLQIDGQKMYTRNSSLVMQPAVDSDMVLRPTGGGQVIVYGPMTVASDDVSQGGTLKVGADGDTHTLELTRRLPEHQLLDMSGEINIGHRQQPGSLRVWGTSNVSDDLTIDGNLIINNGNMNLGQANVICGSASSQGDLSIGGDTVFGRFYNHTLETPSTVRFWNGSNAEQIHFNPITGDAVTQGSLIIEQQAEFGVAKFSQIASDVILGSKLDHTVDIFSRVTTLVNMNASGDAQLGGVDSHDITVYGDWKQTNSNHTRLFEVESSSGDTFANADMYVEKSSHMKNSVSIGDPVNYLSSLTYDEWLAEVFHPALPELYKQSIRTALFSILDPSSIDTWGADPRPDLHTLMTMEDSSQFTSMLSSIGLDDPSAELEPSAIEFRRKFLLAVSRVGDTTHPSVLEVQVPAELDASVQFLDALNVDGTSRLNQMEVGLCNGDNPDTPGDESDGCMADLQICDNGGEECSTTLRGSITVVDGYNTLMSVQPGSGDTRIAGSVEFHRNADLQASVTLGREDATITAGGNVLLHSSLHGHKSLTIESDTAIDGDLNIAQDASVEQSLIVHGDTYLLDEVRVFGDLVGLDPNREKTLFINAASRSMHTDGQLTVQGTTKLLEPTSINASATVNGAAELGASLTVEVDTSIRVDAIISGTSTIKQSLMIGVNATINGNAQLGSIGSDVETYGKLVVQSVGSVEPLLLVQPDIGATVLGTMLVSDLVTFDDDVNLGSKTPPLPVNILSASHFESPVHASETFVAGKMVVRDSATMNAGVSTQGDVTLGGLFQDGNAAAMTVRGAVMLEDDDAVVIVQIAPTSGDFELVGDLGIKGDMFIDGRMSSPYFSAGVVVTDEVVELQGSDDGVTIEGVLFRDGGIEITKINEMVELISEKGVTVEGATSKGGALVLRSDVNSDMLTLTNQNHDSDMANVTTGIDWAQYYHHTLGGNEDGSEPVAHAARVEVATTNSWTEDPGTHNADMIFETAYQGQQAERARITKDGDFLLAYDDQSASAKVLMDAEFGHVHILGNVIVGDTADYNTHQNRTMEVRSGAEQATLVLDAGGSADSSINLKIHGGSELSIRNVNYYSPDREYQERPTLVFNDAHSDIVTLDTLGNLWVSGSAEIGSFDRIAAANYDQLRLDDPDLPELSHPDTLVHLRSSGSTHLGASAGQSSDATLTITSGPNHDATLRLVDPADSTSSATFVISNRGGSTNATLAISDGDSDFLEIIDQGTAGAARFHGDLILSATGNQVRNLRVQSEQAAGMILHTDVDDATVTVTAGHNQDARLVLTDPNGDPESPTYDSKQVFGIVNVGKVTQVEWTVEDRVVQEQTAILAFINGETTNPITEQVSPIHVIALDDVGSEGNLRTTGSGQFGELPVDADEDSGVGGLPGTLVPVTLTVQSSGTAVMSLTAGCDAATQCNDAIVALTSGDDTNSGLELGTIITEMSADAFGQMTIENQVQSTIRTFNMGSPEIVADGQLQSLWTSQNPTLRTTFQIEGRNEYSIMQIVDQGEYGDMAISGNGNIVGAGERAVQIGSTTGPQSSYLNIVSGQEADAIVRLQSAPDLQPGLTLQDTSESGAATFTIRNDGSFATPRMQIVDKDQSSLLEVRTVCHDGDHQCVGDLYITGDIVVGSPDSSPSGWDTGDRYLRIAADQAASLVVEAGLEGEALIRVSSGDDSVASVRLGPRNVTTVDGETVGFDITRKTSWKNAEGNMQTGNTMSINYMGAPLLTVTDVDKSATHSVGNLGVSGDVTVGGKDLESRSLVVASMAVASISVQSGDFADAEISLLAASAATASVTLETSSAAEVPGDPDVLNVFKLSLDGSSLGDPTFKFGDAVNELVRLIDAGVVGNIEVTGNGMFGSALSPFIDQAGGETLPTELTVRAPNEAMLNVVGSEAARLHITSGVDSYAQFSLSARPELSTGGHATSSYTWTNRGQFLTLQDSAHINMTVLAITDMGEAGKLEFAGDATFSTIGQTESLMQPNGLAADVPIDATVTVISGSSARVAVEAGAASPAQLTIESGDNRVSTLALRSRIDTIVGNTIQTEYRDFAFVNDGSAAQPQFQITDGVNPIFTVQDNNGATLVSLPGTLVCENLVSSSRTVLGNGLNSKIVIDGHISSPTLTFDADDDGIYLRLQFEDPQRSTTIVMPDESGTVMTTATSYSQLEGVSDLSSGQIDEGFGSIKTSNNIMTTSSISSDGTVQIQSAFNAEADITIGDESSDAVHFRGVVQNNIRFSGDGCDAAGGCEKGLLFHASQDQLQSSANIGLGTPGKQTILRGHFDATSLSGERQIVVPDVPMGGMLHVNNNMFETMSASNVHQVAFASGATVGEIRSYSGFEAGSGLLAGESDVINLVNPRIKTTSTVIATISDPGDPQQGGWVIVTAVKVSQTDGQCTIKVTNVHPTRAMVNQYEIGFVVFNPN